MSVKFKHIALLCLIISQLAKARPNDLELTEIDFQELKKHLMKKEPQHVYDLIDRYQLDVTTRVFFGKSSGSLPAIHQTFRVAMDTVLGINTKRVFLGHVYHL
jgi:hypothetical protein